MKKRSCKNYCMGVMGPRLVIKVNNSCNGKCFFCVGRDNKPLPTVDVKVLIKKAIELENYPNVLILGGEPTLYKNLQELVKGIAPYKKKITITTNGSNLSCLLPIVQYLDKIIVSIMHYDKEKNKDIVGVNIEDDGKLIKEFAKINPKLKLRVNCVMLKSGISTIEDMKKIATYVKQLGFNSLRFSEVTSPKLYDEEFINISYLLKDYGIHQKDTVTHGCYLEPPILEELFGIKTILNLSCILKAPTKIYKMQLTEEEMLEEIEPMKNVDSLILHQNGIVYKDFQ